jgi:pimeloyl-ACP methyl ester carboxylesterase
MSDLEIIHGGAVAVDTEHLRAIALELRCAAADVDTAQDQLQRVRAAIPGAFSPVLPSDSPPLPPGTAETLDEIMSLLPLISTEAVRTAEMTAVMADAYDLVELRVQRSALTAGEDHTARVLQLEISELERSDPRIVALADALMANASTGHDAGLHGQALVGGAALMWPLALVTALIAGFGSSRGPIAPGTVLKGRAAPVTLRAQPAAAPPKPPTSLASSLSRIPSGESSQVRVEKYTMPDGARQFAVYVTGTQAVSGKDPWDMTSNAELTLDVRSSSYDATLQALEQAGAEPGDAVHAWGHSQGGMIVSHLAMEGQYDVRTVVTAGNPVEPTLSDDVLSVQLRHTDDPISVLAGPGSPTGTGSADSMVVRRNADPTPQVHDLLLHTHGIGEYRETAALVDESGDPRVQALEAVWAELGTAVDVQATEFRAERVE